MNRPPRRRPLPPEVTFPRKVGLRTIGESLGEYLAHFRMGKPLAQARIREEWPAIVGPVVARRTTALEFREDTLWVRLSSAPLRKELSAQRAQVVALIEEHVGPGVVRDVIFR